jgi:hypothetical protein
MCVLNVKRDSTIHTVWRITWFGMAYYPHGVIFADVIFLQQKPSKLILLCTLENCLFVGIVVSSLLM